MYYNFKTLVDSTLSYFFSSSISFGDPLGQGLVDGNIAASQLWSGRHCCPGLGGYCGDVPVAELAPGMKKFPIYCFLTTDQNRITKTM